MRRPLALLLASLILLATAACGGGSGGSSTGDKINGLTVSGSFGVAPKVKVGPAVKVDKPQTQLLSKGKGDLVRPGDKALLNLYIANGKTGKKAVTTYDSGKPLSVTLDDKGFFPPLVAALKGRTSGSRLAFADTVKDLYGDAGAAQIGLKGSDSLVFVVDIMSVARNHVLSGPQGTKVAPPAGLPSINQQGGVVTGLGFDRATKTPSAKLQVVPLVKGKGEPINGPKKVTMNFLGQVYGAPRPFANSYLKQPGTFDIGVRQVIPGWDHALRGQRVGSRLMLIVPPAEGYGATGNPQIHVTGTSTLVFLIDILAVG